MAVQQYNANQALVLNTPLEKQPAIEQAAAKMRDAWLTLQRTKVVSPISGYVSRRSVQVGAEISSGTPLMAVVPADQLWIDANFKETQLANMRIGQPATIVTDFTVMMWFIKESGRFRYGNRQCLLAATRTKCHR